MKIRRIDAHVIKHRKRYELAGQTRSTNQLPGSDYIRFLPYPQLYSQGTEVMIVRLETEDGIVGWGEAQAPIAPEVAQTIVHKVLGPAVLGLSVLDTNVRYMQMYETLRVRGQITGFQLDAIAAIDTALWDIKGKMFNQSIGTLLGGRYREELPCYVTGLREKSRAARIDEARNWSRQGIGIKPCLGMGYKEDAQEVRELRSAIGEEARMFIDGVWKYTFPEAIRVARVYEECGVEFLESPLLPEDIQGHARAARELDIAIAVGEPLRTRFQFQPWFEAAAMDICQPDVMRNGVSETFKIATVAEAFHIPVALHTGALTTIGMSATWQVAAAIPNFFIQEYQPVMLETFNRWLKRPLHVRDGKLVVPDGPGLGLEIDEQEFMKDVEGTITLKV